MRSQSRVNIHFRSSNNLDNTLDFVIGAKIYRYHVHSAREVLDTYRLIASRSILKGFNYVKKRAYRYEEVKNDL